LFTENIATGPYLCGGDCNSRGGIAPEPNLDSVMVEEGNMLGMLQTIIDLSMMMGYCSSATDHCLLCADSCYRWLAVPASRLLLEKL